MSVHPVSRFLLFRLSGFHPYSSEDDTEEEVKENVLKQKCDPNLIHVQASQESLRFVTWALKKDPRWVTNKLNKYLIVVAE
jgi:hypothetical protein